ncbi:glycosyltransferase family 39 protein [Persicobacter psychrovividus]|uniref:Glycosyltransferase RgtA/B/C/D-like domain-containing protein n=1 Tax=Persicobacter psychrovividus TaxID=387638 RepID=A0ABM7VF86_9BACT|nr:hypothetical protein PEPS_17950 [Persicobacter psychrovividus]
MNSSENQLSAINWPKRLGILVGISFLIRLCIAHFTALGNDEVYYWTYAVLPDISHFDHPPLVGWLIRLSSLNLNFTNEVFIRGGALLIGSVNIVVFFNIGKYLKDELTGWYAALLYVGSVYCSIIAGTFILPDTPQSLFWLLGLFAFIKAFDENRQQDDHGKQLLLAGLWTGLAMYSKYHGVFLWMGALLYISFNNWRWWLRWELYAAGILSILIFSPVLYWNYQNAFISFTFHGERVDPNTGVRPLFLMQAVLGQIAYNNPINSVLCIIALVAAQRKKLTIDPLRKVLIYMGLPLVLLFTGVALFKQILPHWTSPGFFSLMLLAAIWLRERKNSQEVLYPAVLKWSVGLILFIFVVGIIDINTGIVPLSHETAPTRIGRGDVTLDMHGWKDLRAPFAAFIKKEKENGKYLGNKMMSQKWFPAAHLDFYVATPLGFDMYGGGNLLDTHEYAWLTEARGGFKKGDSAYYITPSTMFVDAEGLYADHFQQVELATVIPVKRGGKLSRNFYVYRLIKAKKDLHPFAHPQWQ